VIIAVAPLITTVPASDDCDPPKSVPVIVTDVPAVPELTEIPARIAGAATANGIPLLNSELLVTTTFPLVAAEGTTATICVVFHVLIIAGIPPKVTLPDEPKLVPLITTEAPTGPDDGYRSVTAGVTVKDCELLIAVPVLTDTGTTPGLSKLGTTAVMESSLQP
jgi:hypothetical protein